MSTFRRLFVWFIWLAFWSLAAPALALVAAPTITLYTPVAYQVFQRNASGYGLIRVSGWIEPGGVYTVGVTFTGTSTIYNAFSTAQAFDEVLSAPQGQYTVTIAIGDYQTSITPIGVGDIFVVAGQSNAMGYGLNNQVYSHATLRAALFGNNYRWSDLTDPTDRYAGYLDAISVDTLARGSVWPLLATTIMVDQNVPVAFIPTARGGSRIVAWLPSTSEFNRATLFGAMMTRIEAAGGDVRTLLWWQGETDAYNRMSAYQYAGYLRQIADTFHDYTGAPVFAALHQTYTYATPQAAEQIRMGIRQASRETTYIFTVDLTGIPADDSAHLRTDAHLQEAALRWWQALDAELYS